MKTISVLIVVFAVFSTLSAQDTAKLEFDSEVIDYGEIEKGSDGIRVFQFRNVGNAPLIIEEVHSSCECAVPTWTKGAIEPGQSGEIQVSYDTEKVGPIRRTITVYSNADESPKALKIKGKVLDPDES